MPHKGHDHDHDDNFQAMEKGHKHSHDHKDEMSADEKNYEASKKKLYLVSFVTIFFIIA